MPSSDRETTLACQWELLRNHLPSRPPGKSSLQLRDLLVAVGHTVSKRTFERDMNDLSHIFPIFRNEKSVPTVGIRSKMPVSTPSARICPRRCRSG